MSQPRCRNSRSAGEHLFQVFHEEIAHQQQHAAAAAALEQVAQPGGHPQAGLRFEPFDHLLKMFDVRGRGARGEPLAQRAVEHGQAHVVLRAADHVRQGRGQVLDVFELRSGGVAAIGRAEPHRAAGVDRQRAEQVGFLFVDADEGLAGAGQHFPIEPAEVFAAGVFAEIDELARPAQLPRRSGSP